MSDIKPSNKALWERVCITDPKAVKPITGKQYQGNSPKPYWIVERLTEEFGPCGIGWGFTILSERMERLTDTDILHVAVVRLWYTLDGQRGELEQIGQTKAVYARSKGGLMVDEDAPKKSVTDALVKCASYIGFAGDIFSGRWDDSKYVESARKHFETADSEGALPEFDAKDPFSVFTPAQAKKVRAVAQACLQAFNEGNEWGAYEEYSTFLEKASSDDVRTDIQLAMSLIFKPHSALRSSLKKHAEAERNKEVTNA